MPKKTNRLAIFLCLSLATISLMIATGIGRFVFTPILPIMLDEKTVAINEAIWLSSANYIGYFVGAMSLFKNTRHIMLLLAGVITVTIATYFSSAQGFSSIFIFRFLAGVGGAWALISTSAWAVPWLKRHDIHRVGFIYTGVGAGIALSGILCSVLILRQDTATHLWFAVGTMSLVLTLMVIVMLFIVTNHEKNIKKTLELNSSLKTTDTPITQDIEIHQHNQMYTNVAVWRLAMAYGLFGFGYIIPATFLPKIAKDMISGDMFLLVWPIFGVASVIGVSIAQFFHRVSDLHIWKIAQTIVGLAVLLPLLFHSVVSLLITALLIGGAFMLVIMSILKIAAHTQKSYNVVAVVTASFALGQLAGPLPALFLSSDAMWSYILPLSAFTTLLGVAFIWTMKLSNNTSA